MALLTILPLALLVALVIAGVMLLTRPPAPNDRTAPTHRWRRARNLQAVASVGTTVLAAAVMVAIAMATGSAEVTLLIPALSLAAGLVVLAAAWRLTTRPDNTTAPLRQAELSPRKAGSFLHRRALATLLGTLAALVALLVTTGLTASRSGDPLLAGGDGRSINFVYRDASGTIVATSGASPYPGWVYGLVILAGAVVMVLALWLCLGQIAAAPAPTDGGLKRMDEALRRSSTRVAYLLTEGMLLLYLCGASALTAMAAGQASRIHLADGTIYRSSTGATLSQAAGLLGAVAAIALVVTAARLLVALVDFGRTGTARVDVP